MIVRPQIILHRLYSTLVHKIESLLVIRTKTIYRIQISCVAFYSQEAIIKAHTKIRQNAIFSKMLI